MTDNEIDEIEKKTGWRYRPHIRRQRMYEELFVLSECGRHGGDDQYEFAFHLAMTRLRLVYWVDKRRNEKRQQMERFLGDWCPTGMVRGMTRQAGITDSGHVVDFIPNGIGVHDFLRRIDDLKRMGEEAMEKLRTGGYIYGMIT